MAYTAIIIKVSLFQYHEATLVVGMFDQNIESEVLPGSAVIISEVEERYWNKKYKKLPASAENYIKAVCDYWGETPTQTGRLSNRRMMFVNTQNSRQGT